MLQVKEAQPSVLEPVLKKSEFANSGQRVVSGQRMMQTASDIFLGWHRTVGVDGVERDFYVRQLWDWKASANIDAFDAPALDRVRQAVCEHARPRPRPLGRPHRHRLVPR